MRKLHTDREYDSQLQQLRERFLLMAGRVEEMIGNAMRSLIERDPSLARATIEEDHKVNRDEVETDELCLLLLARRQPVASDLRFITLALKMVTNLERIGDLAVNICERSIELCSDARTEHHADLLKMAETTKGMVRDAIDAFVAGDDEKARGVIARDMVVDTYYEQIFLSFLTLMAKNPDIIHQSSRIQSVAKYLERIGDHATNLAEMVVFMVKGSDIRHMGSFNELKQEHHLRGILFLCVHNSGRSQMAEGWARQLFPFGVQVWSAGSEPSLRIDPHAVQAMQEVDIDISHQQPKRISEVPLGEIDMVVTLCAEEVCVDLPADLRRDSWIYPDPAQLEGAIQLSAFRRVRDDLRGRIAALVHH